MNNYFVIILSSLVLAACSAQQNSDDKVTGKNKIAQSGDKLHQDDLPNKSAHTSAELSDNDEETTEIDYHFSVNSPHTQHDEFDYIEPPVASQVADHHDDDHDGVINERDLCLETPTGAEVDNDGCSKYFMTPASMDLRVLFANNSDKINPIFSDEIIELAEFLKEYPNTTVEIEGYASLTGNAQQNIDLSKRRAESVRKELLNYGINAERINIIGYGSTNPATNGTDERSHALNRRVVATVVGEKNQLLMEWTIFTTFPKS